MLSRVELTGEREKLRYPPKWISPHFRVLRRLHVDLLRRDLVASLRREGDRGRHVTEHNSGVLVLRT